MKNLVKELAEVKGCVFGTITYVSEGGIPQKVLGKGVVVTKVVTTQMQFNYSYAKAVNNRLAKVGCESNFEAEELPWGKWLMPNKVITHKDKLYMRYYAYKGAKIDSTWFVNGRIATSAEMELIIAYLRSKDTTSKKQAEHGLTDNQVSPKVVTMENILALNVGGVSYHKNTYKVVG